MRPQLWYVQATCRCCIMLRRARQDRGPRRWPLPDRLAGAARYIPRRCL